MNTTRRTAGTALAAGWLLLAFVRVGSAGSVTVPFTLDHNRMLVEAEMQRKDGSWRKVRLWVDTGNPDFLMSPELATDLGLDWKGTPRPAVRPPGGVRIGGQALDFEGVHADVLDGVPWLFSTMHNDANLPSTVMSRYQVVFDYPRRELTIAAPGALAHRGVRVAAAVHPTTGIVQVDATIAGRTLGFALDNGASYSFASDGFVADLLKRHGRWPHTVGAVGCANIWGWWPREPEWTVVRVPEIRVGRVKLADVGLVGLPSFFPDGATVGAWYSKKTARPVEGFLGPNAFNSLRVEIDFANAAVYLEQGAKPNAHDMDIVGLTVRPQPDGNYSVIGVAGEGESGCVEPGDTLVKVGDLDVKGATMGTVVDALRGTPGETRAIVVDRQGKRVDTRCAVRRFL